MKESSIFNREAVNLIFKVKEVNVFEKKERWGNGGPEVSFIAYHADKFNNCAPGNPTRDQRLKDMNSGSDLGVFHNLEGSALLFFSPDTGGPFDAALRSMGWFLYEHDRFYNQSRLCAPCLSTWLTYSSRDAPFGIEEFFEISAPQSLAFTSVFLDFFHPGFTFYYTYGPNSNKIRLTAKRSNL